MDESRATRRVLGMMVLGCASVLAAPSEAHAACQSESESGLESCRNARRPQNWFTENVVTDLTPVGQGGGTLNYRYGYMLCKNNQGCSRWRYEAGPPARYVEDTACVFKIVRDRVLEAESQCSIENFDVRRRGEMCRDYVTSGSFSPFSGATFPSGLAGRVLATMQPGNPGNFVPGGCDANLNMVTSTHANFPGGARTIDTGIGRWGQVTNSNYTGTRAGLPKVNNAGPYRESATESMGAARGNQVQLFWQELYSKAGDWSVYGVNASSALRNPLIAPYVLAGIRPPITHTACYRNKASAYVQGFLNPAGTPGATATPANIDVTTGNTAPPAGGIVQQLVADIRTVAAALGNFKSLRYCTEARNRWQMACGSIETYAHSMGAIVNRTFGLPTRTAIGSVDAIMGASYRNNCDPVPWVTQQGIRYLLSSVPTTSGKNYPRCRNQMEFDCLDGNRWRPGPGGRGPRTAECDTLSPSDPTYADRCERWWCDGQPNTPREQMYSGRSGMPSGGMQLSVDPLTGVPLWWFSNWEYCPGEAAYQRQLSACIDTYLAGTSNEAGLLTCLGGIINLGFFTASGGPSDHYLQGGATVVYNGYQVLPGLDNLGRPSGFSFSGAYLHNPPPAYPEKPVSCGDRVCEAGRETAQSCPMDCGTPVWPGMDAGVPPTSGGGGGSSSGGSFGSVDAGSSAPDAGASSGSVDAGSGTTVTSDLQGVIAPPGAL
jgi:hypothetical protein